MGENARLRLIGVAVGAALALAVVPAAHAAPCGSPLDDFNRPDSTNLGPSWTEAAEDYSIHNGSVSQPLRAYGALLFNRVSASEVCVDVTASGSGFLADDAGVVIGYTNPTDNLVVKVQNNGGAAFDHLYAYRGTPPVELITDIPITPFLSARLRVKLAKSPASPNRGFEVYVDPQFDGTFTDLVNVYGPKQDFTGRGIGLVSYGAERLDNFTATDPVFAPIATPPDTTPPTGSPGTGTGTGPLGPSVGSDGVKPVLGGLSFSRTAFKAAKSGASTAKKRRVPVGSEVSFSVSEPSSVGFTAERKTTGRKIGRKCKAKTRSNRGAKHCTRWVPVAGSFTVAGTAGDNTFTFRGRIGGKSLRPGSYRLDGRATDAAKNASVPESKGFKIVR